MTPRQFVFRFLTACAVLLAFIAAFNRLVDPFWYYRDIEVKGFNAVKTKFRRFERDVKPALLAREKPEAIILGSSFSEIGFDPLNPSFTRHGQLKPMNYAMAGSNWKMVQCEFEYALGHAPIKRALIGLLPESMPKADCAKDFPQIGQVSAGELLLSTRALAASVQTIKGQKKETPSHTREGMYFYTRDKPGVDNRFKEYFIRQTKGNPKCLQAASRELTLTEPLVESNLDLSGLQYTIALAKQHQVELVLFLYPHHALSLELDAQCGIQDAKWQAMKQIARVNEQLGQQVAAIWQFYGYNSITTEPIAATATYWQDPEHFNFETGNLMLSDMFEGGQPKLGRLLSTAHIDDQYREFIRQRNQHVLLHPEFQGELQKLLPRKFKNGGESTQDAIEAE